MTLEKLYPDLNDAQIRDIAIGDDMEITYIHPLFLGFSSGYQCSRTAVAILLT